jgi:hypothetical protein
MQYKKIAFIVLILGLSFAISCQKHESSGDNYCSSDTNEVSSAVSTYQNSQTKSNCNAVVAAYNSYINDGCDGSGSMAKQLAAFEKQTNNCQ